MVAVNLREEREEKEVSGVMIEADPGVFLCVGVVVGGSTVIIETWKESCGITQFHLFDKMHPLLSLSHLCSPDSFQQPGNIR